MHLGLSLGLTRGGGQTLIQRAIASLRARGTDAHLWLPGVGTINGLTTGNYLESTGNTVATVNNPTGLVLDALGSVGSDLLGGAGAFDSATGWTLGTGWSIAGGIASFAGGSDANLSYLTLPLVVGNTYLIELSTSIVNGSLSVRVGSGAVNDYRYSSSGTFSFYTVADITSGIALRAESSTSGLSISNISVREVSGIHAQQATTANKAVLRRGAYNYLLNSVFAGAAAGTPGTAPTSWTFAFGTGSVEAYGSEVLTLSASAGRQVIFQSVSLPANATHIVSVFVNSFSGSMSAITQAFAIANLPAGTTVTYYKNGVESAAVPVAGDTLSARIVTAGTAGSVHVRLGVGIDGNRTGSFGFSKPQLETGSTASAYSPTTSAAASNPDAGKYSWAFDSTDVLSATIPAGWETATVIDAAPTGAMASVQNVVGTHSIRGAMVTGVNLVTNGGFDTDTTGWTANTATLSIVSGALQVEWLSGVSYAKQIIPTVVGLAYQLNVKCIKGTSATGLIYCGPTAGTSTYVNSNPTVSSDLSFTFTATSTTAHLQLYCGTNSAGNNSRYDNISVYEINPVTHARILVKGTLTEAETNLYKSLANSFK